MKRPAGVTITVIWMALLLSLLSVGAIASGKATTAIAVLVVAIGVGGIVLGLWRGEMRAYRAFLTLVLLGCLVSIVLAFLPAKHHGRLYHVGRAAVMGAWAYYLLRPPVRAYFERTETAP